MGWLALAWSTNPTRPAPLRNAPFDPFDKLRVFDRATPAPSCIVPTRAGSPQTRRARAAVDYSSLARAGFTL